MLFSFLIAGLIVILSGFLVKKYPHLLAGYNTMHEEQKKEIDIDKVAKIARNVLVLTGAAVIDASCIMYFLNVAQKTQININIGLIVLGLTVLIIWVNRVPKLK